MIYVCGDSFAVPDLEYGPCWVDLLQQKLPVKTLAQVCASKDVPGTKSPHLSITKSVTETGYAAVGQVLHYTIVATNDGNVTLASVTVTELNSLWKLMGSTNWRTICRTTMSCW